MTSEDSWAVTDGPNDMDETSNANSQDTSGTSEDRTGGPGQDGSYNSDGSYGNEGSGGSQTTDTSSSNSNSDSSSSSTTDSTATISNNNNSGGGMSTKIKVAIAVPVAVVGAALIVAAIFLILFMRRRKKRQPQGQAAAGTAAMAMPPTQTRDMTGFDAIPQQPVSLPSHPETGTAQDQPTAIGMAFIPDQPMSPSSPPAATAQTQDNTRAQSPFEDPIPDTFSDISRASGRHRAEGSIISSISSIDEHERGHGH